MAKVRIWSDGAIDQGVELDGEDISKTVNSIAFTMDAGRPADIKLKLCVVELEANVDDAKVLITSETRDLLIRSGWQPPASRDGD